MNRSISSWRGRNSGRKIGTRYRKNNSRHLSEKKKKRGEKKKENWRCEFRMIEPTNKQKAFFWMSEKQEFHLVNAARPSISSLLESRKRRQSHGRLARIWISARFLLESAISQVSRVSRASHGFFGFIGSNPFLISGASPLRATRDRCSAWFESRRRLVLGKNVVKARHGFLPWNDTTEYRWKLESFEKTRRFSKEPSPNRVTNPSKIIYSSCVSSLYTFYT